MNRLLLCGALLLAFSLNAAPPRLLPGQDTDPEQQQLEWCFVYSNSLGYDIDYINNPRLYEKVRQWLGTPYHYSGETKGGVDCSGFVCQVYKDVYDLILAGSSRDIQKETQTIREDELLEGDLVFFKIRKSRVSHVGIYLGQNKFAHASVQRGVIISDLSEEYYRKYFYSAGRIKPH
jgi:lipoprotein Spr